MFDAYERRAQPDHHLASADTANDQVARLTALDLHRPIRPVASPSRRPWAGGRIGGEGIGELWLAGPDSLVELDDGERLTLDRLAELHGAPLVGHRGLALLGARFPLLVKVIDAADWLSLQVHPSDALAGELHGAGSVGKAEAWVVLDADPGARLITGPRRDLPEADLRAAIAAGRLGRADCEASDGRPGDAWLVPPGTIHSIGAGLLVYEIEQPSDLTYRISDWGRPAAPGRTLHTEASLRAIVPDAHAIPSGSGFHLGGGAITVPEFRLEVIGDETASRHPADRSLEIVTAARGRVAITADDWSATLAPYDTLVIPAAVPAYTISATGNAMAFVGSIP